MNLLNKTTTFKEIAEWKLHWLLCNINHFEFNGKTEESIDFAFAFLDSSITDFNRMIFELSIMVGFEIYESDVLEELKTLKNFNLYIEAVKSLKIRIIEKQQLLQNSKTDKILFNLMDKCKYHRIFN